MPAGNRRISAIATGQYGAFTRSQATKAEISNGVLRGRIQSDRLVKAGSHTYRDPMSPHSVRSDLSDLLLDIGEGWASHRTAAALHKLDGFVLRPPFHATVVRGRNIQRAGAHIHTSSTLPLIDRAVVDGLAVTSPTRTIIDLAASTDPDALLVAIASAFRDGRSSELFLHQRIVALRGSGRAGCRRLVKVLEGEEISGGRPSWLERRYLELIAAAGLPAPQTEVTLTRAGDHLVRVDCHFEGTDVVVELLGYRWHRTKEQMRRDAERLNQLQLDGFRGFQFTYDQVVDDPASTVDTTRRALGL
ncbi:MAG: hypothetical protein JWM34_3587 [Ilumatobacteraceae bacterium]|nr:hypothetical protein [Ilumatobacteraceae bacterium]